MGILLGMCLFAFFRLAGVKDSGVILGEQGGILDRMDGYLFGVLAMYMVLI